MNIRNYYFKEYFKNIEISIEQNNDKEKLCVTTSKGTPTIKERNNTLLKASWSPISNPVITHSIQLKVLYPGLITGVGINHESSIENEFKLGMHFDYTSGMPEIYGSSVKGVLREYFMEVCDCDKKITKALFADIFGSDENHVSTYAKSIYNRDVFFDAVIVSPNQKGHILESDFITPHTDGPLKNPNPIMFLKIASGCNIEFRFRLVDSNINGTFISAEQKKKWFKEILTTYGVGAKTNVGYGQLTSI